MDIYAPIANRLGMGLVKGELEDLAFLYLEPEEYARIAREVEQSLKGSEKMIEQIRVELEAKLAEAGHHGGGHGPAASASTRSRRRSSAAAWTWRSSTTCWPSGSSTPETRDCYAALGLVHQRWRPMPGRIKDYIAMPKPNFYQSLHTTVMSERGAAVRGPDPHARRWT